jgi:hypothetical protein
MQFKNNFSALFFRDNKLFKVALCQSNDRPLSVFHSLTVTLISVMVNRYIKTFKQSVP